MAQSYPNAWPGWEVAVLTAAKLPVTTANINFLAKWHEYEGSNAKFNPLNVTGYQSGNVSTYGLGSINSAGVQTYGSAQQGAQATATFLGFSNYADIRAALASGDPWHYSTTKDSNKQSIVKELSTWGSHSFAALWEYVTPNQPVPGTEINQEETGPAGTTDTKNTAPILTGWLGGLTSWIENYAIRAAEVTGGFVLLLAGLYLLARQVGLAPTPTPGPVGPVTEAVA